jgi:hypothetical protein
MDDEREGAGSTGLLASTPFEEYEVWTPIGGGKVGVGDNRQ